MAKQTYKVIGTSEYYGHAPGSVFEAELEPESEARAIAVGHITKSSASPKEADPVLTPAAQADQANQAAVEVAAAKAKAK